jgi:hypothetical protein
MIIKLINQEKKNFFVTSLSSFEYDYYTVISTDYFVGMSVYRCEFDLCLDTLVDILNGVNQEGCYESVLQETTTRSIFFFYFYLFFFFFCYYYFCLDAIFLYVESCMECGNSRVGRCVIYNNSGSNYIFYCYYFEFKESENKKPSSFALITAIIIITLFVVGFFKYSYKISKYIYYFLL